ncbi:hypothetical protein MLD38_037030 [Melastoma candidum]|uniref:Uncharacterized protein n=1 Tax=Melastoma candidum TaxID=119954 RepID=A0ACB9LLG3_9MYRT|nr:hypothetical protein MLD38_037030 [Melastoma candidum]
MSGSCRREARGRWREFASPLPGLGDAGEEVGSRCWCSGTSWEGGAAAVVGRHGCRCWWERRRVGLLCESGLRRAARGGGLATVGCREIRAAVVNSGGRQGRDPPLLRSSRHCWESDRANGGGSLLGCRRAAGGSCRHWRAGSAASGGLRRSAGDDLPPLGGAGRGFTRRWVGWGDSAGVDALGSFSAISLTPEGDAGDDEGVVEVRSVLSFLGTPTESAESGVGGCLRCRKEGDSAAVGATSILLVWSPKLGRCSPSTTLGKETVETFGSNGSWRWLVKFPWLLKGIKGEGKKTITLSTSSVLHQKMKENPSPEELLSAGINEEIVFLLRGFEHGKIVLWEIFDGENPKSSLWSWAVLVWPFSLAWFVILLHDSKLLVSLGLIQFLLINHILLRLLRLKLDIGRPQTVKLWYRLWPLLLLLVYCWLFI